MKKLLICISLIFISYCVINAEVARVKDERTTAGTPIHAAVNVVLASTSTTAAVSKGLVRIVTNNSDYPIYKVNASYTVAVTTSTGTPIYSHEHYIEDKWFDAMWFAADPSAGSSTCNVRVETQVWQ